MKSKNMESLIKKIKEKVDNPSYIIQFIGWGSVTLAIELQYVSEKTVKYRVVTALSQFSSDDVECFHLLGKDGNITEDIEETLDVCSGEAFVQGELINYTIRFNNKYVMMAREFYDIFNVMQESFNKFVLEFVKKVEDSGKTEYI